MFAATSASRRAGWVEALEGRLLLAGDAPEVTAVFVNGTSWAPAFRAFLEANNLGSSTLGFETDKGNSGQGQGAVKQLIVPWTNVNEISIQFSEDVSVQQNDLVLTGVNQTAYGTTGFSYNPTTHVATWNLGTPITADIVSLRLDGDPPNGVVDADGNFLKGSGGPGSDFERDLLVLPGDVTRNGEVTRIDTLQTQARQGSSTVNPANYSVFFDVNGDSGIAVNDTVQVRNREGTVLPARS